MEGGEVTRVPSFAEPRDSQIPVGADLAGHGAQVVPEVDDERAAQANDFVRVSDTVGAHPFDYAISHFKSAVRSPQHILAGTPCLWCR
jgi:hypothetical protein